MEVLTTQQRKKITKYWNTMESLTAQYNNALTAGRLEYNSEYDSPERIRFCICHNEHLQKQVETTKGKLEHFEREYEAYVNSIGFKLRDRDQPEALFQFLNNNILL